MAELKKKKIAVSSWEKCKACLPMKKGQVVKEHNLAGKKQHLLGLLMLILAHGSAWFV